MSVISIAIHHVILYKVQLVAQNLGTYAEPEGISCVIIPLFNSLPLMIIVGKVRISHFSHFNTENVMILLRMLAHYFACTLVDYTIPEFYKRIRTLEYEPSTS